MNFTAKCVRKKPRPKNKVIEEGRKKGAGERYVGGSEWEKVRGNQSRSEKEKEMFVKIIKTIRFGNLMDFNGNRKLIWKFFFNKFQKDFFENDSTAISIFFFFFS